MAIPKQPGEKIVDARELRVRFSPAVEDAFRSIAVAARDSGHFDAGLYEIVKGWSAGKPATLHTVITALPGIASEVAAHVRATGDGSMSAAWDDLCINLPEEGFTISQSPKKQR